MWKSYLTLQKMRLPDQFAYTLNVEPGCSEILIPKLILQPLVENCLVHGLDRKRKDGQIAIEIRRQGELIVLSVQDNGQGAGSAASAAFDAGVGQPSGIGSLWFIQHQRTAVPDLS